MSLTEDYKKEDKIRLEEGDKSKKHYLSVNLPGDRNFDKQTESARERIARMNKEREKPNHDVK